MSFVKMRFICNEQPNNVTLHCLLNILVPSLFQILYDQKQKQQLLR